MAVTDPVTTGILVTQWKRDALPLLFLTVCTAAISKEADCHALRKIEKKLKKQTGRLFAHIDPIVERIGFDTVKDHSESAMKRMEVKLEWMWRNDATTSAELPLAMACVADDARRATGRKEWSKVEEYMRGLAQAADKHCDDRAWTRAKQIADIVMMEVAA